MIHDVPAVGAVVRAAGRRLIVDAVSAFGALPFDISAQPEVDAVVFTANKCLEGVPGLAFAVARIDRLLACGRATPEAGRSTWPTSMPTPAHRLAAASASPRRRRC